MAPHISDEERIALSRCVGDAIQEVFLSRYYAETPHQVVNLGAYPNLVGVVGTLELTIGHDLGG